MLAFLTVFLSASPARFIWGSRAYSTDAPRPSPEAASPHPAALGHLGPSNLQSSQVEGHPILPPAPSLAARAPALSLPAAPDRPPPGLSSPAAPPGTEPGVRAAASRGQGRSRSPRAPPTGPSSPRHPPRPGSPPPGRSVLTGRWSPPGRQQERRRGIQRPRPGPGWSAARRSAAPPPAPARAERAGGRPLLADVWIDVRRPDARARCQTQGQAGARRCPDPSCPRSTPRPRRSPRGRAWRLCPL